MHPCSHATLSAWEPHKEFFVGLDSDGCVLDTMDLKHKQTFAPLFVKHYGLNEVGDQAREAWSFVALYSRHRGLNRFRALVKALDLLEQYVEDHRMAIELPDVRAVEDWLMQEPHPSSETLRRFISDGSDPILQRTLRWSLAADQEIARMPRAVAFAGVVQCLSQIREMADTMVVSTAPFDTLRQEWKAQRLEGFVRCIAGQDQGSKDTVLGRVVPGRYDAAKTLMIGDAPGDLEAARSVGAMFYPIVPGAEEASWAHFGREGMERFLTGRFAGRYQEAILRHYFDHLPEGNTWNNLRVKN